MQADAPIADESFEILGVRSDTKDFSAAFLLAYRMEWAKGALYFAALFAILFFVGPASYDLPVRLLTAFIGIGVVAAITGVFMIFWIVFSARRTARDPLFSAPVDVRSVPGGFTVTSERGTYEYKWTDFVRCGQDRRVIVLKTRSRLVLVLPHRFFTAASAAVFQRALASNVRR